MAAAAQTLASNSAAQVTAKRRVELNFCTIVQKGISDEHDDRGFIERATSAAEKLHGAPADTDKMIENFALCGLKRRAGVLESLDTELHGEIDSGSHSLRRHVRLMELRRRMGNVHEALRKARR